MILITKTLVIFPTFCTYRMVDRLIQVKDVVNDLLTEQKADTLLVSEWSRLSELRELLKPFAVETDKLQSNCNSLSYVIPALLELECHLLSCHAPKAITKAVLDEIVSKLSSQRLLPVPVHLQQH